MKDNASRREKILTEPLLPLLIKTSVPTIIGMMMNMLYNLTDTFFIGQLNNKSMTAAIGIVFSFVSFVQAIGFWFGYGSGNSMSRKLGEQDEKEAQILSSMGVVMALFTGIILTVVLLIYVRPFACLIGGDASPQLLTYTVEYLKIIILTIPFSLFALTVYNQLRLCGNVKDGMIGLLFGMLSNMVLDPIFIFTLKMGFAGAGWATLAGQVIGSFTLFFLSRRHGNIPVRLRSARFSKARVYHILAGGAPNFSRQGITGVATAFMIMIGWGQGFQPICAMNYGAKNYDRVKKARKLTISVGTVFLLCVAVLLAVFAVPASALLSKDEEVIRMSAEILRIQCISVPFLGYYTVSSMYMQNIGHYGSALLISIARQGFFYIPLLFLLPALAGQMGLFLVQPVADILSFAFSIIVVHFTPSQTPVSSAPFSSQKASR